ncbi:hypothetical protein U1Q18_003488, partial [Sarracenia purpurea var. burkii]
SVFPPSPVWFQIPPPSSFQIRLSSIARRSSNPRRPPQPPPSSSSSRSGSCFHIFISSEGLFSEGLFSVILLLFASSVKVCSIWLAFLFTGAAPSSYEN